MEKNNISNKITNKIMRKMNLSIIVLKKNNKQIVDYKLNLKIKMENKYKNNK